MQEESAAIDASSTTETSEPTKEEDFDVMQDRVLWVCPGESSGVDPNNKAIRNAMSSLTSQATKDTKKDKKGEDKKTGQKGKLSLLRGLYRIRYVICNHYNLNKAWQLFFYTNKYCIVLYT